MVAHLIEQTIYMNSNNCIDIFGNDCTSTTLNIAIDKWKIEG